MEQPSSNLFEGYKSVGHVTGPLPFIVRHGKKPQDTRIITIVGRTFHTYTLNLSLTEVSIPHEKDIRTLVSDDRHIYTAAGKSILAWGRGSKTLTLKLDNKHPVDFRFICKFGPDKLISVSEENVLNSWNLNTKEILNSIDFEEGLFKITALCHPFSYQDKVILGSDQGPLQLWNIATQQCLYKFPGWNSSVLCINQSPVKDVVGIGLSDGHVFVHNIKFDEVIMKIYQEYGPVTSMSFRLDGQPYLVTASDIGHLMIWNLERKRLSSQIRNAHCDKVSKCQFIRNESLLVTSGSDNTLKIWTLDMSDGCGTLLCQRAGHSEPPSYIEFYGPKSFNLLSAGHDSTIKMFHLYSERLNRNLGTARPHPKTKRKNKASMNKLPAITCFAAEPAKDKQWDNIAAIHENSSFVTTWNYDKCRMGEHFITQPTFKKHGVSATSVCITGCGNFVVIGFSNGFIFRYNIQSGIFRQTYESDQVGEHRAHDGNVTGVTVDSLDIVLVSSGSDSKLRLWNFKTGLLLITTDFSAEIMKIRLHRENNLIALALKNNDIEVMDLETRTLVRKFHAKSTMLDMTFSPDSRWLIVSFEDKSILTWDLSLGKLIDSFRLSSECTSLSISPTGEFLATAHKDSLGINIWCNYTIYCPTTLKPIDCEKLPPLLDMPFVRCDDLSLEDQESEDRALPELVGESIEPAYISPDQLHESLITMSGLPSSRWKNLLNIDEIRKKQSIQEEERRAKPVKVPFFIPVKDGLQPTFDREELERLNSSKGSGDDQTQLMSRIGELRLLSPLAKCLIECGRIKDYSSFHEQMKQLGPSATDVEIRSLGSDTCGDNQPMLRFLDATEQTLKQNIDYELVSSWLALFLKAHSDIIRTDPEVLERSFELLDLVKTKWNKMNDQFNQIFCVLNFVRSSIL